MSDLRCAKLRRRGRLLTGEPYFESGERVTVQQGRHFMDHHGELALLDTQGHAGTVVEILGDERRLPAVMRGLLGERGMLDAGGDVLDGGVALTPAVQRELDAIDHDAVLADPHRVDLRHQPCVTIDPPTAKDFDDAIYVARRDDADGWLLDVHIADVTAYVRPGSALDERACDRALSCYVPGTVAPMLPPQLSDDVCSLRPGRDRAAVSVHMLLDKDGATESVSFSRSLIRSAARLTYDQVDDVLHGDAHIDPVTKDLLLDLQAVANLRYQARRANGSLDLALPERIVELDDDGEAISARWDQSSASHRLVEEAMLAANLAVGARLAAAGAPALYRVHEDPDPGAVSSLLSMLHTLEVPTPPEPDDMSPRTAARIVRDAVELATRYAVAKKRGRIAFPSRALRALSQARYSPKVGVHSALAFDAYVHFTSPIRRYPDLVVHRSLLDLIGADPLPGGASGVAPRPLEDVADHVSEIERWAASVERDGYAIASARALQPSWHEYPDTEYRGEVVGIIAAGAFVRCEGGFEGFVPARTLDMRQRYEIDEAGSALVGTASGQRISLGDEMRVVVRRIDDATGKITLARR